MMANACFKCAVLLVAVLAVSCRHHEPIGAEISGANARCNAVAEKGFINILNINVLFDRSESRRQRFEDIADFAAANDVDVIMLQEIVGGVLTGTQNSALELRQILLEKYNLAYNLATAWEIGEPETWSSANAILSKCEITNSELQQLPFVFKDKQAKKAEEKTPVSLQLNVSLTQNVQLANIDIPGRGRMNLFNTHLCARTDIGGRAEQLEALLEYVADAEAANMAGNPSVIGGDFNLDLFDNPGA